MILCMGVADTRRTYRRYEWVIHGLADSGCRWMEDSGLRTLSSTVRYTTREDIRRPSLLGHVLAITTWCRTTRWKTTESLDVVVPFQHIIVYNLCRFDLLQPTWFRANWLVTSSGFRGAYEKSRCEDKGELKARTGCLNMMNRLINEAIVFFCQLDKFPLLIFARIYWWITFPSSLRSLFLNFLRRTKNFVVTWLYIQWIAYRTRQWANIMPVIIRSVVRKRKKRCPYKFSLESTRRDSGSCKNLSRKKMRYQKDLASPASFKQDTILSHHRSRKKSRMSFKLTHGKVKVLQDSIVVETVRKCRFESCGTSEA